MRLLQDAKGTQIALCLIDGIGAPLCA